MKNAKHIVSGKTMKTLSALVVLGALCGGCATQKTEDVLLKTQNNMTEIDQRVASMEGRLQALDQEIHASQGKVYDVYSRAGKKTGMTARPLPQAEAKPVIYSSPQSNITTPAPYPTPKASVAHTAPKAHAANPAVVSGTNTKPKAPLGTLDPNSKLALTDKPAAAQGAPAQDISELSLPPETAMYIPTGNTPPAAQGVAPTQAPTHTTNNVAMAPAMPPAQPFTPVVTAPAAQPQPVAHAAPVAATGGAKAAYNQALNLVRGGQSTAGRDKFIAFLQAYPNSSLVPNAHYWIGESYYAQGNFTDALFAFKQVTTNFPKHHKTSDALLKAGLTYQKLGDNANAQTQYRALLADFPNSNAAKIVRSRNL